MHDNSTNWKDFYGMQLVHYSTNGYNDSNNTEAIMDIGLWNLDKQMLSYIIMSLCWYFQKEQLLKLNVPAMFMLVALDEGPGPPIKYQYAELGKLYAVVSLLIRCCDVSSKCQSSATASVSPRLVYLLDIPM